VRYIVERILENREERALFKQQAVLFHTSSGAPDAPRRLAMTADAPDVPAAGWTGEQNPNSKPGGISAEQVIDPSGNAPWAEEASISALKGTKDPLR